MGRLTTVDGRQGDAYCGFFAKLAKIAQKAVKSGRKLVEKCEKRPKIRRFGHWCSVLDAWFFATEFTESFSFISPAPKLFLLWFVLLGTVTNDGCLSPDFPDELVQINWILLE
ncbi:MAG: hypothetical protein ACYTA5_25865 [Planctomycetota bacterium]|jgi:hypothetical protein